MVTVAVAGGSGNVGLTIVDALKESPKHKVIVLVRKVSSCHYRFGVFLQFLTKMSHRNPRLRRWTSLSLLWTMAMSSRSLIS